MAKYYLAFKMNEETEELVKKTLTEVLADSAPLVTTPLDRIHVTTLFLGEVGKEQALSVLGASQSCREFVVSLAGVGSFGNKVLFLGVEGQSGLKALHEAQVRAAQASIGRVQSNGYVPHLTLCKIDGKVPDGEEYNSHFENLRARLIELNIFQRCLIKEVGLYEKSTLIDAVRLLP